VAFEVWQVKAGTIIDNIILTDSEEEAEEWAKKTLEHTKKGIFLSHSHSSFSLFPFSE
jgi:hypothetical protein